MSEKTKDSGLKASVQKLGSYLSSMVMPNIGSFIAWGVITTLEDTDLIAEIEGKIQQFILKDDK